ncbi:MAG: hypothetical protein B6241_02395 [Spirochaetaceae bacterium 4572_59]|nr:MAG: hypothetical protein B6241_02395 [Spirochaetaceae bacterium 4572_59]
MKISLIQPPVRDFYQTPHRHSALGCFSVQKILETAGHEVKFYNFPVWQKQVSTPPLPTELYYLKPFLIPGENGPVSWFHQRKHFGPSFEDCARVALKNNPDMIMISCFAWSYAEEAASMARAIRRQAPGIPIEVGGAGPSVNPGWFKGSGLFDRVRTGQAEINLKDFPGVREDSQPVTPIVSPVEESFHGKPQFTTMLTRGCTARCSFCANYLTLGREFRKTAADTIIKMLSDYGVEEFHLDMEDDNLLVDPDYFTDFLERFHRRFPAATLSAENGLDYQKLSLSLAGKLIDWGFVKFNLSMASADSEILAKQKRSSRLDHLSQLLIFFNDRKIPVITYFICGLQGDTVDSVCRNMGFLAGQHTEIGISPFYAVPGLPGFEHPGTGNQPESPVLYCGSSVYPWNGNLTTAQLITAFRLCRLINLLKSPATEQWKELTDRIITEDKLYTTTGKGQKKTLLEVPHMDNEMTRKVLQYFK